MWSFASSISEFIHHAGRVGRAGEKSSVCVFCNARNKKLFPAFVKLCEENGIQCPAGNTFFPWVILFSAQAVHERRGAAEHDSLAQTSPRASGWAVDREATSHRSLTLPIDPNFINSFHPLFVQFLDSLWFLQQTHQQHYNDRKERLVGWFISS